MQTTGVHDQLKDISVLRDFKDTLDTKYKIFKRD